MGLDRVAWRSRVEGAARSGPSRCALHGSQALALAAPPAGSEHAADPALGVQPPRERLGRLRLGMQTAIRELLSACR
jgi:hypothetical protein